MGDGGGFSRGALITNSVFNSNGGNPLSLIDGSNLYLQLDGTNASFGRSAGPSSGSDVISLLKSAFVSNMSEWSVVPGMTGNFTASPAGATHLFTGSSTNVAAGSLSSGVGAQCGTVSASLPNNWSALNTFAANQLALGGVTGATQCLKANSSGVVTGTGSRCANSAGTTLVVGTSPTSGGASNQVMYDSGTVLAESSALTINPSTTGSATTAGLTIAPTWNTTGVVDAAPLVNPTNTASGTGSILADSQIGGVSEFAVSKVGAIENAISSISAAPRLGRPTRSRHRASAWEAAARSAGGPAAMARRKTRR